MPNCMPNCMPKAQITHKMYTNSAPLLDPQGTVFGLFQTLHLTPLQMPLNTR